MKKLLFRLEGSEAHGLIMGPAQIIKYRGRDLVYFICQRKGTPPWIVVPGFQMSAIYFSKKNALNQDVSAMQVETVPENEQGDVGWTLKGLLPDGGPISFWWEISGETV